MGPRSRRRRAVLLTGALTAPGLSLAGGLALVGPAYADIDADAIAEQLADDSVAIVVPAGSTESQTGWDELESDLRDEVEDVRSDELDLKVVVVPDSPDPAQSIADEVLASAGGTVLVFTPDGPAAASDQMSEERLQAALAEIDRDTDPAEFAEEVAEEAEDLPDEVSGIVDDATTAARVAVLTDEAEESVEDFADELDSGFSWGLVAVQVVGVSLLAGAATAVVVRRREPPAHTEGTSG